MKGKKLLSAAGWLLSMGISSVWVDGVLKVRVNLKTAIEPPYFTQYTDYT